MKVRMKKVHFLVGIFCLLVLLVILEKRKCGDETHIRRNFDNKFGKYLNVHSLPPPRRAVFL